MEEAVIPDVGCGTSRILEALTTHHPKKLCRMHISQGILEIVSKKPKIKDSYVPLKCADTETEIPWDDSYYDYALIPRVFHHSFRPYKALEEIRKISKIHAKIIIL